MTTLQDRADIADLLARYALCADRQDQDGIIACFTDDAILDMAHARLEGIAAIRDVMSGAALAKARAASSGLQFDRSTHLTGNMLITLDGDQGHVETSAVVYLVGSTPDGDRMVTKGITYSDDVRRTAEGWRLSQRVHRAHWQRGPEAC